MTFSRLLLGFLGLVLLASIIWAMTVSNFGAAFGMIIAEPWGVVTLIDLYTGFVFASVLIAFIERDWRAGLWIVPIYFLGNIVTALWLVLRWRIIAERIKA
ncbi:MAG: DUF1475 family protein [Labrys sp. (in: a-proteobacteria)]|jgi:hypothetical protein